MRHTVAGLPATATTGAFAQQPVVRMNGSLFGRMGYGVVESRHRAVRPVELHVYRTGGHGRDSADWIASFCNGLEANSVLKDVP